MASLTALLLTCCTGLFLAQEPSAELVAGLDGPQPEDRLRAAQQIAALGPGTESWLEKRVGKGSALAQRGVLLAAALLGTPESQQLLADAARAGRRADAQRAWALLLYGMSHPDAGRDPARDWKRAATDYEGACLLAGYLAHERVPDVAAVRKAVGRKPTVRQQALLGLLDARAGVATTLEGEEAVIRAARLVASVIPGQPPIRSTELEELGQGLPAAWVVAARRTPGRTLSVLRGSNLRGEEASAVLGLREVEADERATVFAFLAERVVEEPSASWLWGLAGELGLALPAAAPDSIPTREAAGLVRLALIDFEGARQAARARAEVARPSLLDVESLDALTMPAVLLLALAGDEADHAWFQTQLASATAPVRSWLQPLWLMAANQFGDPRAREALLMQWSLRLGAGTSGYLDRVGRTYTALVLLAGTEAAQESRGLREYDAVFEGEHDHAITDEFYLDLAVLLASRHYQWRFDV